MKLKNRLAHAIFLTFAGLCLSACTTIQPFTTLPISPSTFTLPSDQLRERFPDIAEYENRSRGLSANTPLAQSLIYTWGEPRQKKLRYGYLAGMGAGLVGAGILAGPLPALAAGVVVATIRPAIPTYYYWRKGNYCIEALVDKTIDQGYKRRMLYWTWYEHSAEGLPEECDEVR